MENNRNGMAFDLLSQTKECDICSYLGKCGYTDCEEAEIHVMKRKRKGDLALSIKTDNDFNKDLERYFSFIFFYFNNFYLIYLYLGLIKKLMGS